jgi:membrane associated rhomboid family serine protease
MAVCYRHPSRETGVSCSNCGRPICPDCMTPTSVGMRCPECARERTKVRRLPQPAASGTWSATNILIAINAIVFLAEVATGVTLGGSDTGSVFFHGALFGPPITGHNPLGPPFDGTHQYWRLLTSGFLHEGLLHIAFNMFFLFFMGRMLEPATGRTSFFAIYLASLLAGSFGALLFEPGAPTVGASGACFGILGALMVVAHARRISIWQSGLGPTLLINVIFTLSVSNISIGGHLGGFVGGLITGWLFTEYGERRDNRALFLAGCGAVALLSAVAAVAVAGGHGLTPSGLKI